MKQKVKVVEVSDEFATVEMTREAMCDGCHKEGEGDCTACLAFGNKNVRARAYNKIGARIGDNVIVESKTSSTLITAAILFLLPFVPAFVAYFVAEALKIKFAAIFTFVIFIATFVITSFVLDKKKRRNPDLTIVEITDSDKNK